MSKHQEIDIDIEPIFLDHREQDRREEDNGPGFLKDDRRSGNRRASGFGGIHAIVMGR